MGRHRAKGEKEGEDKDLRSLVSFKSEVGKEIFLPGAD